MTRLISLGSNCQVAYQINRRFGYNDRYIFDWLISPARSVIELLRTDFSELFRTRSLIAHGSGFRCAATDLIFYHDFEPHTPISDEEFERVRSKYLYLAQKFRSLREESTLTFVVAIDKPEEKDLLHSALREYFRGSEIILISVVSGAVAPNPEKLVFKIEHPEPYVWQGLDGSWDAVFDATHSLESKGHKLSLLDTDEVLGQLLLAVQDKKPFSLIRLGDGEGFILDDGQFGTEPSEVEFILKLWFGRHNLAQTDVAMLRNYLWESIQSADIVGVFAPQNGKPNKFLRPYRILQTKTKTHRHSAFCSADVHLELQNRDLFCEIFKGTASVGMISCRDVATDFRRKFGIDDIQWFPVPEEMHYANFDGQHPRHYPDWFLMLSESLWPKFPGQVWLVGAGILGKYYCHLLKSRGAIAIDIGSVFDQWASFTKRGSVRSNRLGV